MLTARPYQTKDIAAIYAAWSGGASNVVYLCPTGGGKTFVGAQIVSEYHGNSAVIAHRGELVLQQSMMLATLGVRHKVIASKATAKFIMREHRRKFQRHYVDPNARAAVVAVDTLKARADLDTIKAWCNQIGLWVMDEAHHVLLDNKWGAVTELFPHAVGLGETATSNRADGRGIGRHALGVFDALVSGPSVTELMDDGFLSRYKIYAPPSDFNLAALKMGGTGDYTRDSLTKETQRSHIVGDVVSHYQRIAPGKRAIVFAVDIDSAGQIAASFTAAGVRAASVNGKTSDTIREEMVRRFRDGDLDVLVNVDLFGEGFDVPACEVVVMARPTQSLPLYLQMFGRALRVFPGKTHGTIIDHVSNVKRHLLPDSPREWNLDNRDKRARAVRDPDAFPICTCPACFLVYEAVTVACPFCGHKPEPAGRSLPEQVDGDLLELDTDALRRMRGHRGSVDRSANGMEAALVAQGQAPHLARIIAGHHVKRQETQTVLRNSIALWAGVGRAAGHSDAELYRRFYHRFGVDILSAQTLGTPEASALDEKIKEHLL